MTVTPTETASFEELDCTYVSIWTASGGVSSSSSIFRSKRVTRENMGFGFKPLRKRKNSRNDMSFETL